MVLCRPHNAGDSSPATSSIGRLQLGLHISEAGTAAHVHVTDVCGAAWDRVRNFNSKTMRGKKTRNVAAALWAVSTAIDPKTGKISMPPNRWPWTTFRLLISPDKVRDEINGVKYFEIRPSQRGFHSRRRQETVGQDGTLREFDRGSIALKAIHGQVSFRTSRSGLLRQNNSRRDRSEKNGLCAFSFGPW